MKKKKKLKSIDDQFNIDELYKLQFDGSEFDPNFSNLSKTLLKHISSNLWMPKSHPKDDIKTKSWFPIKEKINNNPHYNIFEYLHQLLIKRNQVIKSKKFFEEMIDDELEIQELEKSNPNIRLFLDIIDNDYNEQLNEQSIDKPKGIQFDPSKKACSFIVTTMHKNIKYGRLCNNQCCDNNFVCKNHLGKDFPNPESYIIAEDLCQHIITQRSRNSDRTGMICGNFIFDSKDKKYCCQHQHRHSEEKLNLTEDEDNEMRTFKVRFYPNKEQMKKLSKYFGCARVTYNSCVEYEFHDKSQLNIEELRNIFVTGANNYLADTPKEIRAFAVKEYVTNRNNCCDIFEDKINKEIYLRETYPNREEKDITIPNMTFKKKKYGQSITITKDCVKLKDGKIKIYPEKFSDDPLVLIKRSKRDKRLKKILDGILYHDIKIIKTITNKFYICFTDDIKFKKNIRVDTSRSCAIDPGFRTQGTIYAENKIEEIGPNMYEKLTPLINEKKELNKIYRRSYKKRNNLNDDGFKEYEKSKKNYRLINEKIKNMVNDLHYKAIAKLTNEYTLISIPILNTMQMQKDNKMSKKTKQIISILRQRTFVKRLEAKSKEKEITTRRVTEIMTTKECSNCFGINDPGASERYNCNNCNAKMGRDINASKNIYIQQIAKIIDELLYLN